MFTGIVEGTGTIRSRSETESGLRLKLSHPFSDPPEQGTSIAVSGVCLTVESASVETLTVFLAEETRKVTYLGDLATGAEVNLERALPAAGRFEGHIVQGHVDTQTTVTAVEQIGEDWRFEFALPDAPQYLIEKGSIAIDGISLTIAELTDDAFEIAIIPETYSVTTLSEKAPGDPVHIEYDLLAKYIERLVSSTPYTNDS